jgi:hypothetical protein
MDKHEPVILCDNFERFTRYRFISVDACPQEISRGEQLRGKEGKTHETV